MATSSSSSSSSSSQPAPAPRRSLLRNPYVWFFVAGALTITLLRPVLRHVPEPPPVLGHLPEFRLVSQTGEPFGSAELDGHVFIADFIFTRCPSVCPRMTAAMRTLQQRYAAEGIDDVRLLSISVDPYHDTPGVLQEYAELHGIDPRRWTLLTGELEEIRQLIEEGFRTPLGRPDPDGNLIDIAHSTRLVLIDGDRGIRGYYGSDSMGLDEVFHRSQHVLREMRER